MAGRKKVLINWDEFDKLSGMQCTLSEIASFFDVSEDTIQRRVKEEYKVNFAVHYKKKSAHGKMSLRRAQFKNALGGNTSMQIWLGKQYLGQSDKVETQDTTDYPELMRLAADKMD